MGSGQDSTCYKGSTISWPSYWENISTAVAVVTMKSTGGAAGEAASNHRADRAALVSLSAEFAAHHGDILLAVFGFGHLGIYYALSRAVPKSDARIRVLFSRSPHSVGHAVPVAAGHYHFFFGRTVGPQSDESFCKPPQTE